ncbi:MAG: hypothetical protein AAF791_07500 [Bacteroidota bacterium]
MDRLQCKACGSYSMLPMEVDPGDAHNLSVEDDADARFFTCHVCGDNWLSIRRTTGDDCQITFAHQLGLEPLLKRVAYMTTPVVLTEATVDQWDYLIGDEPVDEDAWHDELADRRHVLRSICSN